MKELKKAIMVLVPYPAQGHVSPMQKLAWAFLGQGFEVVMVLPQYSYRQIIMVNGDYNIIKDEIKWVGLEDGLAQEIEGRSPDFFGIESAMESSMPSELEGLLRKLKEDADVACVVVDLLASWAIKVAETCAIPSAGFWPAMFASYLFISSIPHMLRRRLISPSGSFSSLFLFFFFFVSVTYFISQPRNHDFRQYKIYQKYKILCVSFLLNKSHLYFFN